MFNFRLKFQMSFFLNYTKCLPNANTLLEAGNLKKNRTAYSQGADFY